MHIPSDQDRLELMSSGMFARFSWARREDQEREPTLIVRSYTLQLKYLLQHITVKLVLVRLSDNELGYAVEINDGASTPARLWAIVASDRELEALAAVASGTRFAVHLYNEAAVNVASAYFGLEGRLGECRALIRWSVPTAGTPADAKVRELTSRFGELDHGDPPPKSITVATAAINTAWRQIRVHGLSDSGQVLTFSLLDPDEGGQQETLAHWLTDSLHTPVYRGATIKSGKRDRELTDLLLPYAEGCILVESKALGVLSRSRLPTRDELADDVSKHVLKGIRQLSGASRALRSGVEIFDRQGEAIKLDRTAPVQAVVLVPDLSLLDGDANFTGDKLVEYTEKSLTFVQILDVTELFRVVQAAHMMTKNAKRVTRMHAFDAHLWTRFQYAIGLKSPSFHLLLKIENDD